MPWRRRGELRAYIVFWMEMFGTGVRFGEKGVWSVEDLILMCRLK